MDFSFRRRATLFGAFATLALFASSCTIAPPDPPRRTSCAEDHYESNDTPETAHELPPLQDEPRSSADVPDVTVHTTNDEDWFRVPIKDTGWRGNPNVTAIVSSPSFEVTTWFVCDKGSSSVECEFGSKTNEKIMGVYGCKGVDSEATSSEDESPVQPVNFAESTTDCSGTSDDNGMLYIRVRHTRFFTSASAAEAPNLECTYDLWVIAE